MALTERETVVVARLGGIVESIPVRLGDAVRRGQLLAVLRDERTEQQLRLAEIGLRSAEASHQQARAELDLAESRLARREEAAAMVSREEIESAREQVRIARASLARAQAELERARLALEQARRDVAALRLTSPMDGVVAGRWRDPGDLLGPGDSLMRIAGRGSRWVRFAVPPAMGRSLAAGDRVQVVLEDGAGPAVPATVRHVAPEIDEASGMIFAEAEIDATPGGDDSRWGGVLRVRLAR